MLDRSSARTTGGNIFVDDRPFFPTAVWQQCSDLFDSNINDGINLFMGDGCRDDTELPALLAGRAYSLVDSEHANATGRGVIGWYFPDEWDAFLRSDVKRSDLAVDIPAGRPDRVSFLTLTNHFYSGADPLPQGKGMYPVLFQIPDVVGFDLYPLQVWCRPAFGDVFDAQAELNMLSGSKPGFQWIEVARMEQPCGAHSELDPTPATVGAETWLSIAGGAHAVGYFPNHWSRDVGGDRAHDPADQSADAGAGRADGARHVRQRHRPSGRPQPQRRALRHCREHELRDRHSAARRRRNRRPAGDRLPRWRASGRLGRRRLLGYVRAARRPRLRHPAGGVVVDALAASE